MENLPFKEKKIGEKYLRKFSINIDSDDLKWHRDPENRIIESIEDTDWMIQIDNQTPMIISGKIEIPKEVYHRIIKGSKDLSILVTKLY